MIEIDNLSKVYPENVTALDGISFAVEPGEICGYIGANGAGKSTTIKILCGMLQPTSGTVLINGMNITEKSAEVKKVIGYVPESGALFLSLTPYDFLEFVCRMYDMDKQAYNRRIYTFMEMFDLKNEVNTPMHAFSKGMRQKVLLISSLIHNPDILLWDEPMSGIDYNTTIIIRNLIKELAQSGKTFFYSTHVIESVDKICTKVIILNKGKIAYDGKIEGGSEEMIAKYIFNGDMAGKQSGLYKNESSQ